MQALGGETCVAATSTTCPSGPGQCQSGYHSAGLSF